jgi:hypothetical protein
MNDSYYKNIADSLSKLSKQLEPIYKSYDTSSMKTVSEEFGNMIKVLDGAMTQSSLQTALRIMKDSASTAQIIESSQRISDAWKASGSANSIDISNISDCLISFAKTIDLTHDNSDDYVELSADALTPIGQNIIDIPEEFFIPVDNKRIRIRTEQFLTFIYFLIPLVVTLALSFNSKNEIQNRTIIEQNETVIKQNNTIIHFLEAIDYSHSSQEEHLEFLTESVRQVQYSLEHSPTIPDSDVDSLDNKNE